MTYNQPNNKGFYGQFGGQFVPETLMTAVKQLEEAYVDSKKDPLFQAELKELLKDYVGRENPLYYAKRLTEYAGGAKIYLKREDLNHTGAHKINNALGQVLLAKKWEKIKSLLKQVQANTVSQAQPRLPSLAWNVRFIWVKKTLKDNLSMSFAWNYSGQKFIQ